MRLPATGQGGALPAPVSSPGGVAATAGSAGAVDCVTAVGRTTITGQWACSTHCMPDRAEQHAGEATTTAVTQYQHVDLAGHIDEHTGGRSGRDHDVHRRRAASPASASSTMRRVSASTSTSIAGSRRRHRLSVPVHRVLREVGRHDAQSGTPPVGLGHRVLQSCPGLGGAVHTDKDDVGAESRARTSLIGPDATARPARPSVRPGPFRAHRRMIEDSRIPRRTPRQGQRSIIRCMASG